MSIIDAPICTAWIHLAIPSARGIWIHNSGADKDHKDHKTSLSRQRDEVGQAYRCLRAEVPLHS